MKKKLVSLFLAVITSLVTIIGGVITTSANVALPSISSSKYISTYTYASSGKVYAYTDSSLKTKTGGYIACATDECRIIKISGNAVQVSYPVTSGRKTAWFARSAFTYRDLANDKAQVKFTATGKVTTYRWKEKTTTYGYIAKGDVCYLLRGDSNSSWLQILYPVSAGWKMAWVKGTDIKKMIWPEVLPTGLNLSVGGKTLDPTSSSYQFSATVLPSNATNKTVTWKIKDTSIATVSSSGFVKAIKNGTTTLTATTSNGISRTVNIIVKDFDEPTGINLNVGGKTLDPQTPSYQFSATVLPATATNKTVTWKIKDTSIATVTNTGKVTAIKNGETTLTVTASNGVCRSVPIYVKGFDANPVCASQKGINFIKKYEGFRDTAYKALSTETYYTIGYGHYGADVKKNMKITKAEAEALLKKDIKKYEGYVNKFLNQYKISVNQEQYDALVSFTYNLGDVWHSSKYPTFQLKTYLIKGVTKYSDSTIRTAFTNWNKSGGKIISGLTKRRNAEANLFLGKGY